MHNVAKSPAPDMALTTGCLMPSKAEAKATETNTSGGEGGGGGLGVDASVCGSSEFGGQKRSFQYTEFYIH